jgi:di/tricarboxylate transporter
MTPEITIVLSILTIAVVLLVTEWVPLEVTSFFVLGAVAIGGLVSPAEAITGFSSPAVVTVWAVFILSGGLTRTGVANFIGQLLLKVAGRQEGILVAVIMSCAGVLSAFMNNVAVAALMLPVVMDITRQTGHRPPRLLMPLAYGSLLGGLTTLIGTPPNILVSDALREFGMKPFQFFDFTPIGLSVMAAGIGFVVLIGRHLLPTRDVAVESSSPGHLDLRDEYELRERMFLIRLPVGSPLIGKTLRESRLGSTLGIHVIGIVRDDHTELAPGPDAILQTRDRLIVEGRLEKMAEVGSWRQLSIQNTGMEFEFLFSGDMEVREVTLHSDSPLVGQTIGEIAFRGRYGLNVLAVRRGPSLSRTHLQDLRLEGGDKLLVHGPKPRLEALQEERDFKDEVSVPSRDKLAEAYRLASRLFVTKVVEGSSLIGLTLSQTRLGDAIGMRVLCLKRGENPFFPEPEERLQAEDFLLLEGRPDDIQILQGIEELEIEQGALPEMSAIESARVGLVEAILSPRTALAGKTLRQLSFREKYGLSVIAIWREGRVYRSNLRDMALRFGDALLLYGPRDRLGVLGREPDFMVLTQTAQEPKRTEKAWVSTLIMLAVIVPVILGWVPIYISAVVGAGVMVVSGCLTMAEAYRNIEWKAIFVIAGMLPLGIALERSGAARILAEGVVSVVGPFGPLAVLLGLMLLTFAATCFIPTAALVVLMAPIAITTANDMNLSPHALMMGIAMAASASFMTPVSHPANILVMGPGGYRFVDYMKLGAPLSLVVLIVVLVVLPFFWPLSL